MARPFVLLSGGVGLKQQVSQERVLTGSVGSVFTVFVGWSISDA